MTYYLLSDIIKSDHNLLKSIALAKRDEPSVVSQEQALDIEHIQRRLDMLDQRLDNIDSVVTAVVERVTNQPIILTVICPHCGKNMEIAIIGSKKPTR